MAKNHPPERTTKQITSTPQGKLSLHIMHREYVALAQNYLESLQGNLISDYINNKIVTIGETSLTYRVINHWTHLGLIDVGRGESGRGWRKFSMLDIFWLEIIAELRCFGISTETIKHVQKIAFSRVMNKKLSQLEFHLALATGLNPKQDCFLVVFRDGKADFCTIDELNDTEETLGLGNHLRISFNSILQRIFKSKKIEDSYHRSVSLTKGEKDILEEIRNGSYDVLTIRYKDGRVHRIEKEKRHTVKEHDKVFEQAKEILRSGDFQEVIVQQEGGKVVSIKSKTKKML